MQAITNRKRRRVLIIDDNPAMRDCIEQLFEEEELDVYFATTGESGVRQASAGQPHLILISSHLRFDDSERLKRRLRKNWATSYIPVSFLPRLDHLAPSASDRQDGFAIEAGKFEAASMPVGELFGAVHCALRGHGTLHIG